MLTGAYAQGGCGGDGRWDGTAPAVLSLALHAAALALLLNAPSPRPVEDEARHLLVELLSEAPPAASASASAIAAAAPPAVRPSVPPQPVKAPSVRRWTAEARPVTLPPAGPPKAAEVVEGTEPVEAPVQAADPSPASASGEIQAISRLESEAAFRAYMMRLHERIASHRVYPPQALRRREEGDVRLRVLLARDGRLLSILNLAEASLKLTEAARQAVSDAAPFDPPPKGVDGGQTLAFEVTVAFRLR